MIRSNSLRIESAPTSLAARLRLPTWQLVIVRCNFRCPFGMPEDDYPRDLVPHQVGSLAFEEIEACADLTHGLGVRSGASPAVNAAAPRAPDCGALAAREALRYRDDANRQPAAGGGIRAGTAGSGLQPSP